MSGYSVATTWSFPGRLPGSWEDEKSQPQATKTNVPSDKAPDASPGTEQADKSKKRYAPRQCRICLDLVEPTFHDDDDSPLHVSMGSGPRVTYSSEDGGRLLSPCKCKGSQKYVHEECLSSWRKAAPDQDRNCWECPTCGYKYRLQRLAWGHWISSTLSQIFLTLGICLLAIFLLGFVADPIINLYNFDPVATIVTTGSSGTYQAWDDGPITWSEHFMKGLAGLSLLGFIKFLVTLTPLQLFNVRSGDAIMGRSSLGQNSRHRPHQITWFVLVVGILTVLWAIWKAVRAWSRVTLQRAGERVMDVPGSDDDDELANDE